MSNILKENFDDVIKVDASKPINQDINGNKYNKSNNVSNVNNDVNDVNVDIDDEMEIEKSENPEQTLFPSKIEKNVPFPLDLKNEKNSQKNDLIIEQAKDNDEDLIEEHVDYLNSLVSPSLSTGYSGSDSMESSSNEFEFNFVKTREVFPEFVENSISPTTTDGSFISSLVSHYVSMVFDDHFDEHQLHPDDESQSPEMNATEALQNSGENEPENETIDNFETQHDMSILSDKNEPEKETTLSTLEHSEDIKLEKLSSIKNIDETDVKELPNVEKVSTVELSTEQKVDSDDSKTEEEERKEVGVFDLPLREIPIFQETNVARKVSETFLQISVDFSDSESIAESGPSSLEDFSDERNVIVANESFLTELDEKSRSDFILQINNNDKVDDESAIHDEEERKEVKLGEVVSDDDSKRSETGNESKEEMDQTGSESKVDEDKQIKNIANENVTKEEDDKSIVETETSSEDSSDSEGQSGKLRHEVLSKLTESSLTKWSSQQRLIIVVDEKNNETEEGMSATNITTDCDSNTIITITTATTTSTTTTPTTQMSTQPATVRNVDNNSEVIVSSSSETSKFVSCVDISEKTEVATDVTKADEISPEEEINLNDEPEVQVEAAEAKLEAGREVQSSTLNTNPEQTPSSSPGVMQYLFGCLPCVGNPK